MSTLAAFIIGVIIGIGLMAVLAIVTLAILVWWYPTPQKASNHELR